MQLPTCPDCGGILEPARPDWIAAIQLRTAPGESSMAESLDAPAARVLRCLICGHHEPAPGEPADALAAGRTS